MTTSQTRSASILPNTTRSPLLVLPPETFLQICKSLSPADLLSLSTVCKTFYNDLCHNDSITIQEIWRKSRLDYIPCRELGPLEGMTERDYIKFLMEDKCGFCGVKNRVTRIYWERGVRACLGCFREKTIHEDSLSYIKNINPNMITFLSSSTHKDGNKNWRYWFNQVQSKNNEFQLLSQSERDDWIKRQSFIFAQREQQLALRRQEDDRCREHVLIERRKAINSKLEEMCSLKNPDGSQKYTRFILDMCPSLERCYKYERPFNERGWIILKPKLIKEYHEITERLVVSSDDGSSSRDDESSDDESDARMAMFFLAYALNSLVNHS